MLFDLTNFEPAWRRHPFNRMLMAQAQAENMLIVSYEVRFDAYDVRRAW